MLRCDDPLFENILFSRINSAAHDFILELKTTYGTRIVKIIKKTHNVTAYYIIDSKCRKVIDAFKDCEQVRVNY